MVVNSGMRKSEILNMRFEQINFKHGYILLDYIKCVEGRKIPMNQTLTEIFSKMARGLESKYVFNNRDGDSLTYIKRSFDTALKRAEIHNTTFHTLRHTFASHLVMKGVDLTTVTELLGHKSLNMTLRYSHLTPEHKMKAVNVL